MSYGLLEEAMVHEVAVDRANGPVAGRAVRWGSVRLILLALGALAVLAALAVAANLQDTGIYARLGVPVAGIGVQVVVAVLRLLVTVSSAVAVGSLLYATFVVPAQRSGTVDVDGYRAIRRAG